MTVRRTKGSPSLRSNKCRCLSFARLACSPSNSEAGDRSEDERPTDSATDSAASTSGQEKQHGGVFVVFTDGSVALENYYCNGRKGESIHGGGRVLAASCRRGKLAVLTARDGSSPEVAVYSLLVGCASLWTGFLSLIAGRLQTIEFAVP